MWSKTTGMVIAFEPWTVAKLVNIFCRGITILIIMCSTQLQLSLHNKNVKLVGRFKLPLSVNVMVTLALNVLHTAQWWTENIFLYPHRWEELQPDLTWPCVLNKCLDMGSKNFPFINTDLISAVSSSLINFTLLLGGYCFMQPLRVVREAELETSLYICHTTLYDPNAVMLKIHWIADRASKRAGGKAITECETMRHCGLSKQTALGR